MIRLNIQEGLGASWQPLIERQIHMTLSPVRASLKSAEVLFSSVRPPDGGPQSYRCELHGRAVGGDTFHSHAQHTDGQTAIVDAFARMRRDIARRRQRGVPPR